MSEEKPTIGIIGGTGKQGSGLAMRWFRSGYSVIIGSRDPDRARQTAQQIRTEISPTGHATTIKGADSLEAALQANVIVLTVPYANQLDTLRIISDAVKHKIVIDVTAPLVPPKVGTVQLPNGGSAAVAAQKLLGKDVSVVAAFQNIAAQHLADLDYNIDCDVLVCGNTKADREVAIKLAKAAGMKGWHAGPLANAAASEAMTSVLIFINRAHKIPGSGIRITGSTEKDED